MGTYSEMGTLRKFPSVFGGAVYFGEMPVPWGLGFRVLGSPPKG
jgi:hypothetical protein